MPGKQLVHSVLPVFIVCEDQPKPIALVFNEASEEADLRQAILDHLDAQRQWLSELARLLPKSSWQFKLNMISLHANDIRHLLGAAIPSAGDNDVCRALGHDWRLTENGDGTGYFQCARCGEKG